MDGVGKQFVSENNCPYYFGVTSIIWLVTSLTSNNIRGLTFKLILIYQQKLKKLKKSYKTYYLNNKYKETKSLQTLA